MRTIWAWLAANNHDTNNHDLRNALAAQGYDDRSTFVEIRNVKATLEPVLVGANHVTVAMVGRLFAEADRQDRGYPILGRIIFAIEIVFLAFGGFKLWYDQEAAVKEKSFFKTFTLVGHAYFAYLIGLTGLDWFAFGLRGWCFCRLLWLSLKGLKPRLERIFTRENAFKLLLGITLTAPAWACAVVVLIELAIKSVNT